jgi:hypothetical protein
MWNVRRGTGAGLRCNCCQSLHLQQHAGQIGTCAGADARAPAERNSGNLSVVRRKWWWAPSCLRYRPLHSSTMRLRSARAALLFGNGRRWGMHTLDLLDASCQKAKLFLYSTVLSGCGGPGVDMRGREEGGCHETEGREVASRLRHCRSGGSRWLARKQSPSPFFPVAQCLAVSCRTWWASTGQGAYGFVGHAGWS